MSRPRIIKVFLKSDIAIIWLDIWNVQSGSKAKGLINKCFNIGSYIIMICGVNMNLDVLFYDSMTLRLIKEENLVLELT